MGFRKLMFPIALAIVWVVMCAMAMADFAGFDAATRDQRPAVAAVKAPPSRSALPQGRALHVLARN